MSTGEEFLKDITKFLGTVTDADEILSNIDPGGTDLTRLITVALLRVALNNANQSITGTLDVSGVITSESGVIKLLEVLAPVLTAGYGKIYPKADRCLYFLDSSGVEHLITEKRESFPAALIAGAGTITVSPSLNTIASVKVGRKVYIQGQIQTGAVSGPPSGSLRLTGLLYVAATKPENSDRPQFNLVMSNLGAPGVTGALAADMLQGTNEIRIRQGGNGTGVLTDDVAGIIDANTNLDLSGWYLTDN